MSIRRQRSRVVQFFNQVLMLGKTSVSDLSEHVFDLILELYNIDSHLLLSVLPQLEFKLKVQENKNGFIHSFDLFAAFSGLLLARKLDQQDSSRVSAASGRWRKLVNRLSGLKITAAITPAPFCELHFSSLKFPSPSPSFCAE